MKKQFIIFFCFLLTAALAFLIQTKTEQKNLKQKNEKLSGAMQSMDFWTRQRAYPNDDIPSDAYYKAFEKAKSNLYKNSDLVTPWEEMGPHNIGGRTISIEINPLNPNTIYAGSASGGLWKSYSAGLGIKAWNYVTTGYPVLSVGAIAINPSDTNTIYIGTGEVYSYQNSIGGLSIRTTRGSYGIGILKSTDNGSTWTKSLNWSYNQKRGVEVIRIHPTNPNIIYAGTTEGIFKSTNAGVSWYQVSNIVMVTDILINKSNPEVILAACGNLNSPGKGVYKSNDSGVSWSFVSPTFPSFEGKILFSGFETNSNICWASVGMGFETGSGTRLYKSTDFGSTWSLKNVDADYATYQGWYSHFVVAHPADSMKLLFGGIDIWKSVDGGATILTKSNWAAWYFGVVSIGGPEGPFNYSHADHHCYAINPQNPNMVYFGNDGGVFRTTDFGETFQGCNGSYQSTQFYKRFGVSLNDTTIALGGMQDNATAIWEGTTAWRRVLGGDGCCTQISPTNSDSMLGSYQYLGMGRSLNKGRNWTYLNINSSNEAFNAPFLIAPGNSKIVYAGGSRIHKSTDFGTTWTNGVMLNGDPTLSIAISYTNPDSVYATTAPGNFRSGVFRSINGGNSFTDITRDLPDRYPVDISVDPKNSSIVYVVLSGFGTSHLFKSTNGGENWINIGSGLPDVPTSAIAIDPFNSEILYVGNDLGLFYSTNGGQTWIDGNSEINGTILVMDLEVSPKNKKLMVATHGRGVYRIPLVSIVSNATDNIKPDEFNLYQNYPNPFNGSTVIKYNLLKPGNISLDLYDITGRLVKELISGYSLAGSHEYTISRKIFNQLSSGVYFYKLTSGSLSSTKKLVILK